MPTLISIQGVTSSGKSSLAIQLAKFLANYLANGLENGLENSSNAKVWVFNADSRQVYKNLNVGTAKIEGNWETRNGLKAYYYKDIPHFLIDYVQPEINYGLINYISDFETLIKPNLKQPKQNINKDELPKYIILVGGSGLYSKAIISNQKPLQISEEFKKDFEKLKEKLSKESLFKLQAKISAQDKTTINYSDFNNSRRLVNKILNKTASENNWIEKNNSSNEKDSQKSNQISFSKIYQFGLKVDETIWENKIKQRVQEWTFEQDQDNKLIQETKSLQVLGEAKIKQLGFEYSITYNYIQGKFSKEEWQKRLFLANRKYAKKQLTWLNKQPGLTWIDGLDEAIKTLGF